MTCELIANGRRYGCGSDDACTADKQIGIPAKRVVREDIPYHNGSYDFSALDGECYFEDRVLKYVFGLIGSESEVLAQVSEISAWLYGIQDTDIWDSEIPYYHFHGSCDSVSVDFDESGCGADVTASFTCYPFLIADSLSEFDLQQGENYVLNNGRRARLFVMAESPATITINNQSQTAEGQIWIDLFLDEGQNTVRLAGCEAATIMWREEKL